MNKGIPNSLRSRVFAVDDHCEVFVSRWHRTGDGTVLSFEVWHRGDLLITETHPLDAAQVIIKRAFDVAQWMVRRTDRVDVRVSV